MGNWKDNLSAPNVAVYNVGERVQQGPTTMEEKEIRLCTLK